MAKTVTLVDREGREHAVSSPLEVNRLVFGHGHRLAGDLSVHEALVHLADNGQPEPAPVVGVEPPAPKTSDEDVEDSTTD